MHCVECGGRVGVERRKAIPDTKWCIKCAEIHGPQKKVGFMVFSHKTAPYLVTVDTSHPDGKEALRLAKRANRRGR